MRLNAQNTLSINLYLIKNFQQKVQLPYSKYFTSKILNLYLFMSDVYLDTECLYSQCMFTRSVVTPSAMEDRELQLNAL